MPLSRSSLAGVHSGPGGVGGTLGSGSVSTTSGGLLVALGGLQKNNVSGDQSALLTISNSGTALTWTSRAVYGGTNAFGTTGRIWTAPVAVGASTVVTMGFGSLPAWGAALALVQYTGQDVSPIGVNGNAALAGLDGPQTLTLSGTPLATSEIIGGRFAACDTTGVIAATPPASGYTELYDISENDAFGIQVEVQNIGGASSSFSWLDVDSTPTATGLFDVAGLAIEIKALAVSGARRPYVVAPTAAVQQASSW